jgi:hypothetical protein
MTTTTLPLQSKRYGKSNVTISSSQFHLWLLLQHQKTKDALRFGLQRGTFRKKNTPNKDQTSRVPAPRNP